MIGLKSKKEMIREMFKILNIRAKYEQTARSLSNDYRVNDYEIREIVLNTAMDSVDTLMDRTVDAYDKAMDRNTVKAALKFYKSSEGKKFIEANKSVESDLSIVSKSWMMEVLNDAGAELLKKKAEKGINYRDYLPPLELNKSWR